MRILATFDESALSEATIPTLAKLAVLPGVEIALCAIAEVTASFDEAAIRARSEKLEAYLRRVATALPDGTAYTVGTDVAMYPMDSASVLIKYVKERECDMVVMATHGRTGLVGQLLGSVANEIVRSGVAPVLLVHP